MDNTAAQHGALPATEDWGHEDCHICEEARRGVSDDLDALVIRQADTIARLTEALEYIEAALVVVPLPTNDIELRDTIAQIYARTAQAIALAKDTGQAQQGR